MYQRQSETLQSRDANALELWGGHECTVNRVGDQWFDQTLIGGHEHRIADLALFADLGITRLRYPALWERMAPDNPDETDFRWTDERLEEIRRLGMAPILTLCHHGSGPHYTSLVDENFATGLARHAAAVAQRYPWVQDYTPVNEPLTTARFSALYGYWYPHTRDEGKFWLALLNEIDATRLAMRAIRAVNPAARLIQTDDLGYCHATDPLRAEADFQNERRWIGWDLLCGTVVPGHALWERIAGFGLGERLRIIADDPCPPDVIGMNHYLSSERLLDHRVERHGERSLADRELGELDGIPFVDVDAIRNMPDQVLGIPALLEQVWQRYGLPVAITECHHGATREDQARWFVETWRGAEALRARGVDVQAVTAWSLLGAYDWNRMVTRFVGFYEPGVYDLRGGEPRPTLMAPVLKALAAGTEPESAVFGVAGWWCKDPRAAGGFGMAPGPRAVGTPDPLLIVGTGVLADLAAEACERRGLHYVLAGDMDEAARAVRPWALLATALTPGETGALGRRLGVPAACLSADTEAEPMPGLLQLETGPIFTAEDDSLPCRLLDALDRGDAVDVDRGALWAGGYGPVLIDGALDLLLDGADGRVTFGLPAPVSEAELAQLLAVVADREPELVREGGRPIAATAAARTHLPPLEFVLERFVHERRRCRVEPVETGGAEFEVQAAE